ncbi:GNAT family N-acetyltransferase [Vibrio ulleungensis]|uniref:GNAT family N-acetyltransferase n=1 Tax=Vibrio ulleungensis TaxID=2807619 RepID=A0ABS2HGM2_9VIBR|nr:GNAT family N-acetyltransferase [Vibrio ulleungensis]MBM7035303.1 GNAT family N-acetyltransferase [Vibrio ulleungensis]
MDIIFERVSEPSQVDTVVELANIIWTEHYTPIIGAKQVSYMLANIHSQATVQQEIQDDNNHYYLIKLNEQSIGYIGIKLQANQLFLSKIYVLSSQRGAGIGGRAVDFIKQLAHAHQLDTIFLTVNKYNEHSIAAYKRIGFKVIEEIVADIGAGYVMDDYKMELQL